MSAASRPPVSRPPVSADPHPPDPRRADLAQALAALVPADPLEEEHRRALVALLDAPGDPFARDHFAPGHFTASAFVLSPDGADTLLVFHEKLRRWLQPGGHFEPGDDGFLAAARREVGEETGLHDLAGGALLDVDVHVIPARKADPEHRHFDVRVAFQAPTRAFSVATDALAGRWVPLVDVGRDPALPTDESVMRAVRKLLRRGAA